MRKILRSRYVRYIACVLAVTVTTLAIPVGALAAPAKQPAKGGQVAKTRTDVRGLTEVEMRGIMGRGPYRNAYFSGRMPWHRDFHDVNLCTGNLMKSFTDIQVAPARGAGLVLQRTYNSNDDRVGPFGRGWTHAYEIRMEEATSPSLEDEDISFANQSSGDPASKVDKAVRTDFFGGKHVYKRDADGLYTPPPYMHDWTVSEYQAVLDIGPGDVLSDTEIGLDGTEKHFVADGNERICDYIRDRHGNTTTLEYSTYPYITNKLLTRVTDPSGRQLNFTWTNLGDAYNPVYRITQVVGPLQTVTYEYYASGEPGSGDEAYNLKAVHLDPSGLNRTTTYTYTSCTGANGTEYGLLASIADPLGQTVSYEYSLAASDPGICFPADGMNYTDTVWVSRITEPGGLSGSVVWEVVCGISCSGAGCWPNGTCYYGAVRHVNGDDDPLYPDTVWIYTWSDTLFRSTEVGTRISDYADIVRYVIAYNLSNDVTMTERTVYGTTTAYDDPPIRRQDNYTYGSFGNVLTHSVGGFPEVDRYLYYTETKYFQKWATIHWENSAQRQADEQLVEQLALNPEFGIPRNQLQGRVVEEYDYGATNAANTGDRGSVLYARDARYQITGRRFAYAYNEYGQKTSEINLNNVVTTYAYEDPWGNLTRVVQDPGGLNRTTDMIYDEAGRVRFRTDPNGRQSEVVYNAVGQPISAIFPTPYPETITYDYAANGRLGSVTDNHGTTTLIYETGSDRVSSVVDSSTGKTVHYTYTPRGMVASKAIGVLSGENFTPEGGYWTYEYNLMLVNILGPGGESGQGMHAPGDLGQSALGDPNSYTDFLRKIRYHADLNDPGRVVLWGSDLYGQVKYAERYDGGGNEISYCVAQNLYDRAGVWGMLGPLTHGWVKTTANTFYWKDQYGAWQSRPLSQNDYLYDTYANRQSNAVWLLDANNQEQAWTENYEYDELNRLDYVSYEQNGPTQSYTFDPMGNRLSLDGVAYQYNTANMLRWRGAEEYTYDANGNTLTGGGRTNVWDSQNRLVSCTYNGNTSTFTYGADGLRRSMTAGGVTTDFVLDGQNVARELRNGATHATYLTGPRGVEYREDASGQVRWYLYDGLGSVIAELGEPDQNNNPVKCTWKYDVYGAVRGGTGSGVSNHKFVGGLGHTSENETGLIYMRARYYDPVIGRFISEDTVHDGDNWYVYCDNNPVNVVDPTGEFAQLAYSAAAISAGFAAATVAVAIIGTYMFYLEVSMSVMFARKPDIQVIDDILGQLGITDRALRRQIHDQISKQHLTEEQIRDLAETLRDLATGKGKKGWKQKRREEKRRK